MRVYIPLERLLRFPLLVSAKQRYTGLDRHHRLTLLSLSLYTQMNGV